MNLSPAALLTLARDTLTNPARVARQIMALNLSVAEGLMAVILTAVTATLLTAGIGVLFGPPDPAAMQAMFGDLVAAEMSHLFNSPFYLTIFHGGLMILTAFLMWRVGKVFGGTGRFAEALSLIAWIEVISILLTILQILTTPIPIVTLVLLVAGLALPIYLFTHFTAALNGFTSLTKTFFGILGTAIAVLLVTSFALMFIIPVPNV